MNKVVQYDVVVGLNHVYLVNQVNERIKQGWQPYGSLAVTCPGPYKYHQAMVKYAI